MILYVDMEHEKGRQADWGQKIMAGRIKVKYRVEDISGQVCLIARYQHISPDFLAKHNIQAVLLSGSGTDPEHYPAEDLAGLNEVLHGGSVPVLGLCGGWQFLAQAFGADILPIGPYGADDPIPDDEVVFREEMKQEYGFKPVRILKDHPLLAGVGKNPVFWHAHYMEIKNLPPGFHLFVDSAVCMTQMAVHEALPVYGTQFHPEHYDEEHLDGKIVLENFFRLANVLPQRR